MLSEQITVTTTATSIRQLIADARSVELDAVPKACVGVLLRYDSGDTEVVSLSDGGSVAGAVVLAGGESLFSMSWTQVYLDKAFLIAAASPIVVHIVVEQDKRG